MFGSPLAPQDIHVRVQRDKIDGNTIMKLVAGSLEDIFIWEDWIDAAMGFIKGVDSLKFSEYEIRWRKRTPWKCDLSKTFLDIPKESKPHFLPCDIRVYIGWPLFDIKLAQFEMNQFMKAAGLLNVFGEVVQSEGEFWVANVYEEVGKAEELLLKILVDNFNQHPRSKESAKKLQ